jgi:hypothetical protein
MPSWTQSNFFDGLFGLFMSKLTFNDINVRENRIDPAFDKTFQWIFRSPQSPSKPWSSFVDWLLSPQHVYWITGKAGSGKSTLMKYIIHNQSTQDLLRIWANNEGGKQLVTASFYLWNAGSQFQRTQEGMLRSLLYKALEMYRDVASENSLLHWNTIFMSRRTPDHWTYSELEQAFHLLLADTDCNFCLFIDGLDELEGDLSDLIQLVYRISNYPNIKICVSSRPWMIFEDEFATKPQLILQHLTYPDIVHYINSTLGSSIAFKELCALAGDDRFAGEIVEKIANKSSGVFLWVVLAVRSLMAGLQDGDGPWELEKRLDTLPPELEDLFRRILHNFESHYFSDAAVLFEINLASTTPPTLLFMSFAIEDPSVAWSAGVHLLDQRLRLFRAINMRRRLNSRCKGLLEVGIEPKSILLRPSPTGPYASDNDQIDALEPKSQVSQSLNMQEPCLEDKGMALPDALLDMSNVDPTKLSDFVNARIEYLHRTVREFLERKEVRAQLQAATPLEWNPHSALARAHLLQLKWVYHMREIRVQSEAWSGIFKILLHSVRAEQLGESQASLMEALENAVYNNLVDDQGLRRVDTIAAQSMGRIPLEHSGVKFARSEFLQLIIRCGPQTYLRDRICTISDLGTIRGLLETATEQYQEGYYRFPDGIVLHRHKPDPALVEALLDQGQLSGSTVKGIWRDRIRQAVLLAENPQADKRKPDSWTRMPSTRQKDLEILEDEDDNENIMMTVPTEKRVFEPSLTYPRPPAPCPVNTLATPSFQEEEDMTLDTDAIISNASDSRHTTNTLRHIQDSSLDTQRAGTAGSGATRVSLGDLRSKFRSIFRKRPG